eukprot:jgi/Botrbrau1/16582/Bobra.0068s0013.1
MSPARLQDNLINSNQMQADSNLAESPSSSARNDAKSPIVTLGVVLFVCLVPCLGLTIKMRLYFLLVSFLAAAIWHAARARNAAHPLGELANALHEIMTVMPEHLTSILLDLRVVRAGTESISRGLSIVPTLSNKQSRSSSNGNADPGAQYPIMQMAAAPQMLAEILSELTATRRHMANVDARLWFLPRRGKCSPRPPEKVPLATVGAIPQNLADIAAEVRLMRGDLLTMNRRLAWISRKVAHPHQATAPHALIHTGQRGKGPRKLCAPLEPAAGLPSAKHSFPGLQSPRDAGSRGPGTTGKCSSRGILPLPLPLLRTHRRTSSSGSLTSWRPSSDGEQPPCSAGMCPRCCASDGSSSEGESTPTSTATPIAAIWRASSWPSRPQKRFWRGLFLHKGPFLASCRRGACSPRSSASCPDCPPDSSHPVLHKSAPFGHVVEPDPDPLSPRAAAGCFPFHGAFRRSGKTSDLPCS